MPACGPLALPPTKVRTAKVPQKEEVGSDAEQLKHCATANFQLHWEVLAQDGHPPGLLPLDRVALPKMTHVI